MLNLPVEAAGVGIGSPLSVLITVAAERRADASQLISTAVPDAMIQTRIGLNYLHARARYFLSCGQYHAALSDFGTCGKLVQQWGFDQPTFVPWRAGAAEAHAALGNVAQARRLLDEQLRLRGAHNSERVHYETQAQLATLTEDADGRVDELRCSAQRLAVLGLTLPTARCLADLAEAQRLAGHAREAKHTDKRAKELGMECGTARPASRLPSLSSGDGQPPAPPAVPHAQVGIEALTKAERRVYRLAVQGKSNRDIAAELFVTTSTVEQHLTRIYRKLSVKRRKDLGTVAGIDRDGAAQDDPERNGREHPTEPAGTDPALRRPIRGVRLNAGG